MILYISSDLFVTFLSHSFIKYLSMLKTFWLLFLTHDGKLMTTCGRNRPPVTMSVLLFLFLFFFSSIFLPSKWASAISTFSSCAYSPPTEMGGFYPSAISIQDKREKTAIPYHQFYWSCIRLMLWWRFVLFSKEDFFIAIL